MADHLKTNLNYQLILKVKVKNIHYQLSDFLTFIRNYNEINSDGMEIQVIDSKPLTKDK